MPGVLDLPSARRHDVGVASSDTVLRLRAEGLEWRALDADIVALDLQRAEYVHVNRSGAELWRLLAAGTTRAQLVRHLSETYGLSEAQASADVDAFLAGLYAQRLLEPRP